MKKKIQLIEKMVNTPGELVRISEDLDKEYGWIIGLSILDGIGKGHLLKSSTIGGKELFPKDFEADFFLSDASVSPNERFYSFRETAKGKKIEIEFQDSSVRDRGAYPYMVKLYLLLENDS